MNGTRQAIGIVAMLVAALTSTSRAWSFDAAAVSVDPADVSNVVDATPAWTHRERASDEPSGTVYPAPTLLTAPASRIVRGRYESVQVNVNEDGENIIGDAANEPSIAIDATNPSRMSIGWRQFDTVVSNFRQAGWAYCHDGGRKWTFPGVLEPGEFSSDPVLGFDNNGNFYYYALQSERGPGDWACYMYKSSDGGVTWPQEVYAWGGDKQWMTVDRSGRIGDGNLYCCWSSYFTCCDGQFSRSTDGGLTFMTSMAVPRDPMWGTLTVGPDGRVFVSGYDYWSSEFVIARSSNAENPAVTPQFDFGVTVDFGGEWRGQDGPNPGGLLGQLWVASDHSNGPTRGNIYMLCSVNPPGSDPLDLHFTRSTDGGVTWSGPVRVNDDAPASGSWQWFGTLSVAPNGRIDAVWNDTRDTGATNVSELYYASSADAGQSWSENVPVSPPFDSHVGWPSQDKIGDYYDMISDNLGVNVAYSATFNEEQDVYFLRIGPRLGDVDDDRDLDLFDFAEFQSCVTVAAGPGAISAACAPFDFNADAVINLADYKAFHAAFTGPR